MSRDPLSIVDEFLRYPDPQMRKNAVTALALVESEKAIRRLVEIALSDSEPQVRKRAEDEILRLDGQQAEWAVEALGAAMKDSERRLLAYAALGRLRSRGLTTTCPQQNLPVRLS